MKNYDIAECGTKCGFVVLHYNNFEDTVACVDSLLTKIVWKEKEIVVVDNASPNGSGRLLADRYRETSEVTVLLHTKNDGFARGNNIGFRYAVNELSCDFVVLLNNDTLIQQHDFCKEIVHFYKLSPFAVLGPKITSLVDGENQNPVPYALHSTFRVLRRLCGLLLVDIRCRLHLPSETGDPRRSRVALEKGQDYQLFGCCLILSPLYIARFDGLYPGTFMYGEEDILKFLCEKSNLPMIYSDCLEIFHKEGSSTQKAHKTPHANQRFYYKNALRSVWQLLMLRLGWKKFGRNPGKGA